MFEKCTRRTTTTTEAYLSYQLTSDPSAQVSSKHTCSPEIKRFILLCPKMPMFPVPNTASVPYSPEIKYIPSPLPYSPLTLGKASSLSISPLIFSGFCSVFSESFEVTSPLFSFLPFTEELLFSPLSEPSSFLLDSRGRLMLKLMLR